MAKICVTEQSARRQRWIENGLLELMQKRRYEQITVTDLCCHLGLARRSFYRYFRDLEDVLDSLLTHTFQDMAISDIFLGVEDIRQNMEFWLERRPLLDALSHSGMMDKLFEYTLRFTDGLSIGNFLTEDGLQMDISREANMFIVTGSISLIIAWYQEGFRKTPEQMARIAYRMLTEAILRKE